MNFDDTISAISTPIGEGGIGIVRISGSNALKILRKIFSDGNRVFNYKSHTMHYGFILDPSSDNIIDEVLVSYMKAPRTYTREDIVEINCHGGILPVKKVLDLTIKYGARLAEPGEFTMRAFLNGRIDLSQAEAVIDIIRSKTDLSHISSINQLKGGLSNKIKDIRDKLLLLYGHIEALNDFPEDEVDPLEDSSIYDIIIESKIKIGELLDTFDTGKVLREGYRVVIIGKPNVGKSSLLNAILKENRAIVTEVPGTTRDIIEEYINIKGIPVKITDTAGIRRTDDIVEQKGIERSLDYLKDADLVIFMVDASDVIDDMDKEIMGYLKGKEVIVIANKIDLLQKYDKDQIKGFGKIIEMSTINGYGLENLYNEIYNRVFTSKHEIRGNEIYINTRHKDLLDKALETLKSAENSLRDKMPIDLVSIDLKSTIDFLGQITGDIVNDEVLHNIFGNFCIGK